MYCKQSKTGPGHEADEAGHEADEAGHEADEADEAEQDARIESESEDTIKSATVC